MRLAAAAVTAVAGGQDGVENGMRRAGRWLERLDTPS